MRESNFAFPAQNRACVCISSQLYDRRALDTTSPLPLFNSLTHLTYLTSTSPRIREIMTMDGGLERLVRILHDFCMSPPPPENPSLFYGLSPPNSRPNKLVPTLNPTSFDKHAAYRFSLAFQCIVNIGVRGSEPIRSRVVQAGTLDVVGCILEAWLAGKGFAVGPSSSATGIPRETREQRLARRQAAAEQRERDQAAALLRALQRQIQVDDLDPSYIVGYDHAIEISAPSSSSTSLSDPPSSAASIVTDTASDVDTSTDTSTAATPIRSNTPTGAVLIDGRDRSGTVIGRTTWDDLPTRRSRAHENLHLDPETEDDADGDADGDVDMDRTDAINSETSPSPEPRNTRLSARARRAVGIVSDGPQDGAMEVNADAHIIINNDGGGVIGADGVGVEDGIVSLEPNDDFAMGAPPGAPGAIVDEDGMGAGGGGRRGIGEKRRGRTGTVGPDVTPRQVPTTLPGTGPVVLGRAGTIIAAPTVQRGRDTATATPTRNAARGHHHHHHHHHHHRENDSGPYRDEDVLLSLQLLAYLSKYPHVRQAFYKPRTTFHPASINLPGRGIGSVPAAEKSRGNTLAKETQGFFKAFGARGKEKEKEKVPSSAASSSASSSGSGSTATVMPTSTTVVDTSTTPSATTRHTNVFSLVERFTFRPSSTESDMPNPPPRLPPEIQYWAGVIMRNACRKDESRGGIRQCANMLCGKWETYPREFAKCRRCRKAKYCGKECQSTAWSEGHRFWCSAKEGEEDGDPSDSVNAVPDVPVVPGSGGGGNVRVTGGGGSAMNGRMERRVERERERFARERALAALATNAQDSRSTMRLAARTAGGTGTGAGDFSTIFSNQAPHARTAVMAASRQATLTRNHPFGRPPAGIRTAVPDVDANLVSQRREVLYQLQNARALGNGEIMGRRRAETVTGTLSEGSRASIEGAAAAALRGRRRLGGGTDGDYETRDHDMDME